MRRHSALAESTKTMLEGLPTGVHRPLKCSPKKRCSENHWVAAYGASTPQLLPQFNLGLQVVRLSGDRWFRRLFAPPASPRIRDGVRSHGCLSPLIGRLLFHTQ